MKRLLQSLFSLGCLTSVIAPVVAIIVYPSANWLFFFPLLGIALIVFGIVTRKQPTPAEVADRAERLLDGSFGGWDVDNYEHLNPKNEQLKDLWRSTMSIGGFPEEWPRLEEDTKGRIREVIAEMRSLPAQNS
ncbi:MAG TPA: hypothetical protein VGM18_00595 [Candidatus Sulfotelmatobacter sp.]|jgi:hypothetical protein